MYAELSCGRRVRKSCQNNRARNQDAARTPLPDTSPRAFYDERGFGGALKVLFWLATPKSSC
jgi:hypothetical protein